MLSDLFSFLHKNPPYMGQEDSEALIDAVVYTMMVDKVIDPDEMEKVEDLSDKLHWKGEGSVEDYVRQSITRALENKNFNTQAEPYLQACAERMNNPEARKYTRKACLKMVNADGEQTRTESALTKIIDKVFG